MYFGNFFRNEKFHSLLSSFYFLKYFSPHNGKNEFVKSRDLLKVDSKITKFYTEISKNRTRVMAINIPHMYQRISDSIFPTLEKYLK